jgi:hypothetical protein
MIYNKKKLITNLIPNIIHDVKINKLSIDIRAKIEDVF